MNHTKPAKKVCSKCGTSCVNGNVEWANVEHYEVFEVMVLLSDGQIMEHPAVILNIFKIGDKRTHAYVNECVLKKWMNSLFVFFGK